MNAVLRDLDHDGTYELIIPQQLGAFEGRTCPQPLFPEVYSWSGADYDKVCTRFPEFYRDEVLPRLERRLQQLEALPPAADSRERVERRGERDKYAREIAEARKRLQK